MSLSPEELKILSAPFPESTLGVKVQSTSKDKTKAMLVLYLQHTDVMGRLEQVDPGWEFTVLDDFVVNDTRYVRGLMTVKGVKRENVGEGNDPKAAYSDAVKRCAMLFGVGRYLYDSDTVWVPYDDSRDRYRIFTYADYQAARKISPVSVAPERPKTPSIPTPVAAGAPQGARTAGPAGLKPKDFAKELGGALSPPRCMCGGELRFSSAKQVYYCANFKDQSAQHGRNLTKVQYDAMMGQNPLSADAAEERNGEIPF